MENIPLILWASLTDRLTFCLRQVYRRGNAGFCMCHLQIFHYTLKDFFMPISIISCFFISPSLKRCIILSLRMEHIKQQIWCQLWMFLFNRVIKEMMGIFYVISLVVLLRCGDLKLILMLLIDFSCQFDRKIIEKKEENLTIFNQNRSKSWDWFFFFQFLQNFFFFAACVRESDVIHTCIGNLMEQWNVWDWSVA